MVTQEEFVADCYLDYAIQGLEPGNPEHGNWHKAHYPKPRCLGGIEWVWLLEEHHAIQSVLQSEECNHPCVFSWERKFLTGKWSYLEATYDKWMKEKNTKACLVLQEKVNSNPELKNRILSSLHAGRENWRNNNTERAAEVLCKLQKGREKYLLDNPEHLNKMQERSIEWRKNNPEGSERIAQACGDGARKWVENNPEQASNRGKMGGYKTAQIRMQCAITGHISTPMGLSNYQKARGIDHKDPANRIRLN